MRWRKSAGDGDRGVFLEGTSSELADFGETGSEGFASAWASQTARPDGDTALDEFGPPEEDKRTRRSRDLDRRSRRGLVVLGLLAIVVAGAAVAVQQGVLSNPTGLAPETPADVNILASIADPRVYEAGPATVAVEPTWPIDSAFVAPPGRDPDPADEVTLVGEGSVFGMLFWGGRSHVAIAGPDLDLTSSCVIVSLAAEDLRVVDLAVHGVCGDRYSAAGDRVACRGENVTVLEVWPYDPDAVVPRPEVTTVRVRIEAVDPQTQDSQSLRGAAPFGDEVLERAERMNGKPGDEATVRIGAAIGTCTLVDRAEVPVQLL